MTTPTPWALALAADVFICARDTETRHNIALALDAAKAEGIKEAARICDRASPHNDCDRLGMTDPETGVSECSAPRCGDCHCDIEAEYEAGGGVMDEKPKPPEGTAAWSLHWLYHARIKSWVAAEWDGAMWCVAGTRDGLEGWRYIAPAILPAWERFALEDDHHRERLATWRAVLATLQQHERAVNVVEAARALGDAMNNCQPCEPEFRALWAALDAYDKSTGEG